MNRQLVAVGEACQSDSMWSSNPASDPRCDLLWPALLSSDLQKEWQTHFIITFLFCHMWIKTWGVICHPIAQLLTKYWPFMLLHNPYSTFRNKYHCLLFQITDYHLFFCIQHKCSVEKKNVSLDFLRRYYTIARLYLVSKQRVSLLLMLLIFLFCHGLSHLKAQGCLKLPTTITFQGLCKEYMWDRNIIHGAPAITYRFHMWHAVTAQHHHPHAFFCEHFP